MRLPHPSAIAGLALTAPVAVAGDWSLTEYCWSTWLAGLILSVLCVVTGGAQLAFTAPRWRPAFERGLPVLGRLPRPIGTVLAAAAAAALAAIMVVAYGYGFAFYGIFLSFFAEMEPHALFGRNGFINSDFWTPVRHLAAEFWMMSVGTVVAFARGPLRADPWTRMLHPSGAELVRVHVMVVLMPFLALGAWALFGEAYQTPVVVLLMTMFFLWPARPREATAPVVRVAEPA